MSGGVVGGGGERCQVKILCFFVQHGKQTRGVVGGGGGAERQGVFGYDKVQALDVSGLKVERCGSGV